MDSFTCVTCIRFSAFFDNEESGTELKLKLSYCREQMIVEPPGGGDYADVTYRRKTRGTRVDSHRERDHRCARRSRAADRVLS